ncbi:MAG: hypothetical protein HY684_07565 [Chloroflexi bacterium]|nr:hypothetical protein [Chloroflexota bacterium]
MKIIRLDIFPVSVPRKSVFRCALHNHYTMDHVFVRLHTDEGVFGEGEACPNPPHFPDTVEAVVAALERYLGPAIIGQDCTNIGRLHEIMDNTLRGMVFAKAAIDMAAHDALGKLLKVSACSLLGGQFRDRIELAQSIPIWDPGKTAQEAVKVVDQGFFQVKLKVGLDKDEDIQRVHAVRKAIGPGVPMRVDGNCGYLTAAEAIEVLRRMNEAGLDIIEQPLDGADLVGMAKVREALTPTLLADESIMVPKDVPAVLLSGAADAINVKVCKAGGLLPAIQAAWASEAFHAPVVIGSQHEAGLGTAAGIHLAAACRRLPYPNDPKTCLSLVEDVIKQPIRIERGYAYLPQGPGLGVELDDAKLQKYLMKNIGRRVVPT